MSCPCPSLRCRRLWSLTAWSCTKQMALVRFEYERLIMGVPGINLAPRVHCPRGKLHDCVLSVLGTARRERRDGIVSAVPHSFRASKRPPPKKKWLERLSQTRRPLDTQTRIYGEKGVASCLSMSFSAHLFTSAQPEVGDTSPGDRPYAC